MGPRLRYKTVGRGCEPARKGRGGTVHNTRHTRGSHTQASRTLSRASHRDGPEGYRSHASTQSLALLRHPYAEDSLGLQGVRARNLTRENQTSVPTPQRTRTEQRGREKKENRSSENTNRSDGDEPGGATRYAREMGNRRQEVRCYIIDRPQLSQSTLCASASDGLLTYRLTMFQ